MRLNPYEEAQIEFMRRTGYIKESTTALWKKDNRKRREGKRGPAELSYELFAETLTTSFRLAFVSRDESIAYPYRELTDDDRHRYWNEHRNLFTRYNGDSFGEEEVADIIYKRLREEEYFKNVEEILLQLEKEKV